MDGLIQKYFLKTYAPSARPLLLLLDGHSSQFEPSVLRLAAENGVLENDMHNKL